MAHGDYTGNSKAVLAQKFAEQQQLKAREMSLVTQVVNEHRGDPIDLMTHDDHEARERQSEGENGETLVGNSDPSLEPVKFQASDTVEAVTVGKDRFFNLEQGQVYIAPRWLVAHLDEKHLVRH